MSRLWSNREAPILPKYDAQVIIYTSDSRIEAFITTVIVVIGLGMLIAPMWILNFLDGSVKKLACITAFIVVFLGLVSYATTSRPFEGLGATAASVMECLLWDVC